MKPETKFRQSKVIPFISTLPNTTHFSVQQQAIRGTPDILACINGKFIALELKAENGVVSLLQAKKLSDIDNAGGLALVVTPSNWKLVLNLLYLLAIGENHGRQYVNTFIPDAFIWREVLAKARANANHQ